MPVPIIPKFPKIGTAGPGLGRKPGEQSVDDAQAGGRNVNDFGADY